MANTVTWPAQDFSRASTTEVVSPGLTRWNLAWFCAVSSSRCASTQAFASSSPSALPTTADSMMVLPAPVGATPSVSPCSSSAAQAALDEHPLPGTEEHAGAAPHCAQAGRTPGPRRGISGGGGRRLRRRPRRHRAHVRGVVLVVGGDGDPDLVLVLAAGVLADVDPGQELEAVQVREAPDAPLGLRLGRAVLVRDAVRRVQDAAHQAPAHVGPLRALGAHQPDQAEDLAPRVLALEDRVLAVQVDGAGVGVAGGVAAGPALLLVVVAARADGQPHLGDACPWG